MLIAAAAVLLIPLVASAGGTEVDQRTQDCGVGWGDGDVIDPDCEIFNAAHPNGGYTLVLHGQIPDSHLEVFQASGVTQFETSCFAAYLFVVYHGHAPVFVDSVRHFTPDGKMTETCHYRGTRASIAGERLSLFGGPVPGQGEPFHVSHGFAFTPGGADDPGNWDFVLHVNGLEAADSGKVVTSTVDYPKDARRVYNFSEGMTGWVHFEGYWYMSCGAAVGTGFECDAGDPPGSLTQSLYADRWVNFGS